MLRMLLTRCRTEKIAGVYGAERSLDDDVTAVKHYIEANYRRKIVSADLEKLIHFKLAYVMTHFKKQTGMTIMGYAIRVRTERALDDYLTHDIPISEAAKKNGFSHYNHFTKACHKYYGASPTEIKNVNAASRAERSACLLKSRHRVFVKNYQMPFGICLYK